MKSEPQTSYATVIQVTLRELKGRQDKWTNRNAAWSGERVIPVNQQNRSCLSSSNTTFAVTVWPALRIHQSVLSQPEQKCKWLCSPLLLPKMVSSEMWERLDWVWTTSGALRRMSSWEPHCPLTVSWLQKWDCFGSGRPNMSPGQGSPHHRGDMHPREGPGGQPASRSSLKQAMFISCVRNGTRWTGRSGFPELDSNQYF